MLNLEDNNNSPTFPRAGPASTNDQNEGQRQITPRLSTPSVPRRRILATVKVVRADIGANGKPCNMLYHQTTTHINLYNEDQARLTYITSKVREEMDDQNLVIVGPNGLLYHDQDGTRGIYIFWLICPFLNFVLRKKIDIGKFLSNVKKKNFDFFGPTWYR